MPSPTSLQVSSWTGWAPRKVISSPSSVWYNRCCDARRLRLGSYADGRLRWFYRGRSVMPGWRWCSRSDCCQPVRRLLMPFDSRRGWVLATPASHRQLAEHFPGPRFVSTVAHMQDELSSPSHHPLLPHNVVAFNTAPRLRDGRWL